MLARVNAAEFISSPLKKGTDAVFGRGVSFGSGIAPEPVPFFNVMMTAPSGGFDSCCRSSFANPASPGVS